MNSQSAIFELLNVMTRLRSPEGCPWDREQDHRSLRFHAVEEVYELIDAIEAGDDTEMIEELGDLLLQVVFHCQLAGERQAFDFETVCRHIVEKLIRRHPHVFGEADARSVEAVWSQWEQIKNAEKSGTRRERNSALDGIPRQLPSLLRAEKLVKKARKAGLLPSASSTSTAAPQEPGAVGEELFRLVQYAQSRGWSAEELLRDELWKQEERFRNREEKENEKGES